MASPQVVKTSVTKNSPSQDSSHPDDHFQSRYVTPGFKPFSYISNQLIRMISPPQVDDKVGVLLGLCVSKISSKCCIQVGIPV